MVENIQFNSEIHDKSYPNEIYSVSYSDSNTDSWELSNLRIKKKNKECPIINLLFADPGILLSDIENSHEYTIENNICLARPFDKDYLFFECKDISESNMNIAKKIKKNTYDVACYNPDDDLHNKFKQDVECMVEIEKYD
ncbi:hypothetical protein SLOPH_560 [Spraguea lophii 42_110]|uniref:Uncharacterized protein n=1 Tax=Spraguea lophii (strain 42_110) TaxID=1358809 RepID=S7W8D7_SPRLO|nr:hypothetical protein SLOPH_560 [Spraguea lophii 42_110]